VFAAARIRPADSVPEDWNWEEERDAFIRYAQRRALGSVDGCRWCAPPRNATSRGCA
jgi:hypothetical protein